jgi:hypothetical protein
MSGRLFARVRLPDAISERPSGNTSRHSTLPHAADKEIKAVSGVIREALWRI